MTKKNVNGKKTFPEFAPEKIVNKKKKISNVKKKNKKQQHTSQITDHRNGNLDFDYQDY